MSIFQCHVCLPEYVRLYELSSWVSQQLRFTACERDGKNESKTTPKILPSRTWKGIQRNRVLHLVTWRFLSFASRSHFYQSSLKKIQSEPGRQKDLPKLSWIGKFFSVWSFRFFRSGGTFRGRSTLLGHFCAIGCWFDIFYFWNKTEKQNSTLRLNNLPSLKLTFSHLKITGWDM